MDGIGVRAALFRLIGAFRAKGGSRRVFGLVRLFRLSARDDCAWAISATPSRIVPPMRNAREREEVLAFELPMTAFFSFFALGFRLYAMVSAFLSTSEAPDARHKVDGAAKLSERDGEAQQSVRLAVVEEESPRRWRFDVGKLGQVDIELA